MKLKVIFGLLVFLVASSYVSYGQTRKDSIAHEVNLKDVTVKGRRPIVKDEGTMRIVSVKGTMLADMGNLGDVLRATPGMIMKGDNSFEVMGKGQPKYYVDGKEVTFQDIMNTIKSDNISKIEIEREPSAKYPVGTNAVVYIVTIKPLKDMVSLNLQEAMSIRRKFLTTPSVNFLLKKGLWTTSIVYRYSDNQTLNKETYFKEIYHPANSIFRTDEANRMLMHDVSHSFTWGNDFQLAENHLLSFEYYFKYGREKDTNDEVMSFQKGTNVAYKDIYRTETEHRNLHNFSLAYSGDVSDNSSLSLSVDYSLLHNKVDTRSLEENRSDQMMSNISTLNKPKYNILTLNGSYNTTLFGNVQAEIGARYYYTRQNTHYFTDNPAAIGENARNQQLLKDQVSAGYFTLQRRWKRLTLKVGGRYEYSDTRITAHAAKAETEYLDKNHSSSFLPSVNVVYSPLKRVNVIGNYSRSVDRPGYMSLNPYQVYKDSLNYSMGNRDLLNATTDRYALYLYWKNLIVFGSYTHTSNEIESVAYCRDLESNQVREMPINFKRIEEYMIGMGYSQNVKKVYLSATGMLSFPKCSYLFLDQMEKSQKANLLFSMNMYYTFNPSFKAYTSFTYQGSHDHLNYYQKMANNWTVGLQKKMLKDKLTINLNFTDILHKAHYNNMTVSYINTRMGTYGTNDMRGVTLSASFKLFNKRLSVDASRNSDDALDRTY